MYSSHIEFTEIQDKLGRTFVQREPSVRYSDHVGDRKFGQLEIQLPCTNSRFSKNSLSLSTASNMVVSPPVVQDDSPPPRKKLRQEASTKSSASKEPRLFVPFRALGLVTNHIPIVLQTRSYKGSTDGPKIHLLTCLGRSWALWEGEKMTLLFVGMCVARMVLDIPQLILSSII